MKINDNDKLNEISDVEPEYWQDVENKVLDPEYLKAEFSETEGTLKFDIGSIKKDRRSFLKAVGFSFTALPLASCMKIPVKKALPYLSKSDNIVPGVANWYATAMDPTRGSALLVKTREGRPIKIEGNPLSPLTFGGTMGTDQASVLSLYDSYRFRGPLLNGAQTDWQEIDKDIKNKLDKINENGKDVVLVTKTVSSPSVKRLIDEVSSKLSNFRHVVYEPYSYASISNANKETFGYKNYPTLRFDKADVVVSFSADFLGTWLSPVEYTKQYSSRRDLVEHKDLSKIIVFESIMSLTGSNADERFTVSPKEEADFIMNLLAELQRSIGKQYLPEGRKLPPTNLDLVKDIATKLIAAKGKSLVVSGSQLVEIQILINAINHILDNYGNTIDIYNNPYFVAPNDNDFENLLTDSINGKVGGIILWDVNPVHSHSRSAQVTKALSKIGLRISFNNSPDETTEKCTHIIPEGHFLETWNDYFQAPNVLTFAQPVISPLFATRMAQESLMTMIGTKADYFNYVKSTAKANFHSLQSKYLAFDDFFTHALHDGVVKVKELDKSDYKISMLSLIHAYAGLTKIDLSGERVVLYEKVGMRLGEMINNPWLQEMPDPITKVTWDNYFIVGVKKAKTLGITNGKVIKVATGGVSLTLPVLVQPGVHHDVIGVAIGYGRTITGKAGKNVGGNAFPLSSTYKHGYFGNSKISNITLTKKRKDLALTQTHHSMEGRDIVREAKLEDWKKDNKAGNKASIELISMWSKHDKTGQQWAMAIDLNKCTGCSGCIISCNAENNVPVVGREEVKNRREMHWLRIDRYYKGDDENPEVVHQPVMCQHCDNAPCETVCPVLATVQSSDGLNQQIYNRCVGTRYCANNCPYKVRRFNWFEYPHKDKYENMVLNPDVVVRSRGVMEKCSMCVHRIQTGKLEAKKDGRKFKDGDVKIACQQSCPGDAIVFGDLNDPKSKIAKLLANARTYRLLEEINVDPRVSYLTKIRNKG